MKVLITDVLTMVVMDISPEQAAEWLTEGNYDNRKLRNGTVDNLVTALEQGNIVQTGEAITFDVRGRLVNGQHRLNAIARSGITWRKALVVFGAPVEARTVVDTHASRSFADSYGLDPRVAQPINAIMAVHRAPKALRQWYLDTFAETATRLRANVPSGAAKVSQAAIRGTVVYLMRLDPEKADWYESMYKSLVHDIRNVTPALASFFHQIHNGFSGLHGVDLSLRAMQAFAGEPASRKIQVKTAAFARDMFNKLKP
jgi:hypothetical protein